jgi:uncharacterized protein (DUF1330 family)
MSAYLFIKTRVTNPAQYQKYVEAVRRLGAEHGSRYIARSRPIEVLEGSAEQWGEFLLLVSEFPSVQAARDFWHSSAYQEIRRLREGAGEVHVVLAEELPSAPAESVSAQIQTVNVPPNGGWTCLNLGAHGIVHIRHVRRLRPDIF